MSANGIYLNDVPIDVFLDYFSKKNYAQTVKNTPVMEDSLNICLLPKLSVIEEIDKEKTKELSAEQLEPDDDGKIQIIENNKSQYTKKKYHLTTEKVAKNQAGETSFMLYLERYVDPTTKEVKYIILEERPTVTASPYFTSVSINAELDESIFDGEFLAFDSGIVNDLDIEKDEKTLLIKAVELAEKHLDVYKEHNLSALNEFKSYFKIYSTDFTADNIITDLLEIKIIANEYTVPKVSSKGENVYRDANGLLTTKESYDNTFFTHQKAIRKTFAGLTDNNGWMFHNSPRKVVLLSSKNKEEFAYYDEYIKTTTYTEVTSSEASTLNSSDTFSFSKDIIPKNAIGTSKAKTEVHKLETKIRELDSYPQYSVYSTALECHELRAPISCYDGSTRYTYDKNARGFFNESEEKLSGNRIVTVEGKPFLFKENIGFYNGDEELQLKAGIKIVKNNLIYTYYDAGFYTNDTSFVDTDADGKTDKKYTKKFVASDRKRISRLSLNYIYLNTGFYSSDGKKKLSLYNGKKFNLLNNISGISKVIYENGKLYTSNDSLISQSSYKNVKTKIGSIEYTFFDEGFYQVTLDADNKEVISTTKVNPSGFSFTYNEENYIYIPAGFYNTIENDQPSSSKMNPTLGDTIIHNNKIYTYEGGYLYHITPVKISNNLVISYNGKSYRYSASKAAFAVDGFYNGSTLLRVSEIKDGTEVKISGSYYTFFNQMTTSSGATVPTGFYKKYMADGSIIYSPEIKTKAQNTSDEIFNGSDPDPQVVVLNVYDRSATLKGVSDCTLRLTNDDMIHCYSTIGSKNTKSLCSNIQQDQYKTTIMNFKGEEPYILLPIFSDKDSLASSINSYLHIEFPAIEGKKIFNGRITGNALNVSTVEIDFDGEFAAAVYTSADLGLTQEQIDMFKDYDVEEVFFVKINLNRIDCKLCRKMLCEISRVAESRIEDVSMTETHAKTETKFAGFKTVYKTVTTLVRNFSTFLFSFFNKKPTYTTVTKTYRTLEPIYKQVTTEYPVTTTASMAVTTYQKDKYKITDYFKLEYDDFLMKYQSSSKTAADKAALEMAVREKLNNSELTLTNPSTLTFTETYYYENYYSLTSPYIKEVITYKFKNPTSLLKYPATKDHPDFNALDLEGVVLNGDTIQYRYKNAGRYYENEIAKLRGNYITENLFFNNRRSSLRSILKNLINNQEEEIQLSAEALKTNGFVNIYNYCKGINHFVKNDAGNSADMVITTRNLNKVENSNFKLIIEKKKYSGMYSTTVTSADENGDPVVYVTDSSNIKINMTGRYEDNRELLERLSAYKQFPLSNTYEKYLSQLTATSLDNSITENNVNILFQNNTKPSYKHMNSYVQENFDSILRSVTTEILSYINDKKSVAKDNITIGSDYYNIYYKRKLEQLSDGVSESINTEISDKEVYTITNDRINEILEKLIILDKDGNNRHKWEVL